MKERVINLLKLIIALVLFFNISNYIIILFHHLGIDTTIFDPKDIGYLNALIEGTFVILLIILYRKYFVEDLNDYKLNQKNYINKIFMYIAIFFAIKIFSSVITSLIAGLLGMEIGDSENQKTIIAIAKHAPIMMFLSASILAPIVEEGIFRLGLKKVIGNKYLFILSSGLIFGFMHIFPTDLSLSVALTYSITYVTMGVYLAYVYEETDNIWIPIMIHVFNNLLSMLAIILIGWLNI